MKQLLYQQLDGVAMDSTQGPTFANTFLSLHKVIWLNNCPLEFQPKIYKGYVDDTFLLSKNMQHVENLKQYLNSQHMNIKFTSEIEIDNSMAFLDIKIEQMVSLLHQFIANPYSVKTLQIMKTLYPNVLRLP